MNDRRMGDVLQQLRQIVRPVAGDADLLRRWAADRDEAAFELLLYRHGPMVLGVCRRVLRDGHEAEDALQATFLALARKAASIGKREAVAGWLYRVAYRAALGARARAARRPTTDAANLDRLACRAADDVVWRDLRPVLDEEVSRLAAKYREPFVLHYLQGRTNEEVARELGCPVGTVLSRLSRARERLRLRLTRRGLALSAAALALGLTADAQSAAVPVGVVGPLVKAATLVALGRAPAAGLVSANAVTVAAEILRGMTMTKVKLLGVVVLVLGLVGTGAGALVHQAYAAPRATGKSGPDNATAAARPPAPPEQPKVDDPRKVEDLRRFTDRKDAIDRAEKVVREAEDVRRDLEQKFKAVYSRHELVQQEERLRSLERQQATAREREQEEWKSLHAIAVKGSEGDRKRLQEFEQLTKKSEEERTERLIEARLKMVRQEEQLREIERDFDWQREAAQTRLRNAVEKLHRLEDVAPPSAPPSRTLGDVERKLQELLRDVEALRRAEGK